MKKPTPFLVAREKKVQSTPLAVWLMPECIRVGNGLYDLKVRGHHIEVRANLSEAESINVETGDMYDLDALDGIELTAGEARKLGKRLI